MHDNTLPHNSCISLRIEASSVKAPWPFLLRIADIVGRSRGNGSERIKRKSKRPSLPINKDKYSQVCAKKKTRHTSPFFSRLQQYNSIKTIIGSQTNVSRGLTYFCFLIFLKEQRKVYGGLMIAIVLNN